MQVFKRDVMFEPSRSHDAQAITAIAAGLRFRVWDLMEQEDGAKLTNRFERGSGPAPKSFAPIMISATEATVVTSALEAMIDMDRASDVAAVVDHRHILEACHTELQRFTAPDALAA